MSEHTTSSTGGKTRAQDYLGLGLAGLGAFSAVSIFQAIQGQEAQSLVALPVQGLMSLVGAWPGLLFSIAFAILGISLFLKAGPAPAGRQLVGLIGAGVGMAILFGGIDPPSGGALGGFLPAALGSLGGLIGGLTIGAIALLASTWITWQAVRPTPVAKPESAPGLAASRQEDPGGVSAAEAFALQPGSSTESAQGRLGTADVREERSSADVRPLSQDEALRSSTYRGHAEAVADPAGGVFAPAAAEQPADEDLVESGGDSDVAVADAPPLGRFEAREADQAVLREGPLEEVGRAGAAEAGSSDFAESAVPAWEETPVQSDPAGSAPTGPSGPSWEQVGLFDEGEEAPPERDGIADRAPAEPGDEAPDDSPHQELETDEEESDQEEEYEEEEEPEEEEEIVAESEPGEDEGEDEEEEGEEEEEYEEYGEDDVDEDEDEDEDEEDQEEELLEAHAEEEEGYTLTPHEEADEVSAVQAALDGAHDPEANPLVFEAGRLILDENRVAVSMLQRRFEIDFDQACEILDQLQSEGLIGPYVGGRAREILMTKEDWEAKTGATA